MQTLKKLIRRKFLSAIVIAFVHSYAKLLAKVFLPFMAGRSRSEKNELILAIGGMILLSVATVAFHGVMMLYGPMCTFAFAPIGFCVTFLGALMLALSLL